MSTTRARKAEKRRKRKKEKIFLKKGLTSALGFGIISPLPKSNAAIAQSVEHVIGNDEVIGPNPISSSIKKHHPQTGVVLFYGPTKG